MFLPGIERSIVSGLPVPLAVVVVTHYVDVVQVLVQPGNVVGNVDGGSGGADGGGQDVTVFVHGDPQVLDERDEVLLVFGFATSLACNKIESI